MNQRFALLAGLPADAIGKLGLHLAPQRVAAGEALFRQGDPSTGLLLIESGTVRLFGRTPGDGEVELARLGAGEMVGEFSLLDGGVRAATAVAEENAAIWCIDREAMAALVASGEGAALAVIDRLRVEVASRTRATLAAIAMALAPGAGSPRNLGALPAPSTRPASGVAALLASFPGFDRLDAPEWAQLEELAAMCDAPRGTALTGSGFADDRLIIVARGAVRSGIAHPAGGIEQVLVHGPGSFAGAAAMMAGSPIGLVPDVREDAVLLLLDRAGFDRLRSGATSLGRKLFEAIGLQMVRDLRRLSRTLGRLSAGGG